MRNRRQTAGAKNNQRTERQKAPGRVVTRTAREAKKSQTVKSVVQKRAKPLHPKETATPAKTNMRTTSLSGVDRSDRNHGPQGVQSVFEGQMQLLDMLIKWSPLSIFLRMVNARA
jgi:hypothetical protein